jgi:isoquinoline 1-oxidoreductase beta subunit
MNTFIDDSATASSTSRREFLKIVAIAGAGLVIGINSTANSSVQAQPMASSFEPNAFLKIGSDGSIVIISKNPEIGQGIKTSLPQIIAEELEVDWKSIVVQQGGLDQRLGQQGAGGSAGVKSNFDNLRKAGAAAREMLVEAASLRWNVSKESCNAKEGFVTNSIKGEKLSYGQLAEAASKLKLPDNPKLKDIEDFVIIGKPLAGVDNEKIVTGKAEYGLDSRPKGMSVAVIRRSPVFGGKVKRIDESQALKIAGVEQVIRIEPTKDPAQLIGGVAIIARNTWAAIKASKALIIEWDIDSGHLDTDQSLRNQFEANINKKGEVIREDGDIDKVFSQSERVIEQTFAVPFLAHASLEPQNYIADVRPDSVEVWGPTQSPGLVRFFAVGLTGVARDKVKVSMTRSGGGFGRRLAADYACEAIYLSKAIGKPVQVVWTREDDMTHDFYRPAGKYKLKAALDTKNRLAAWHLVASTTARGTFALPIGNQPAPPAYQTEVFPDSFPAGFIPNFRVEYTPVATRVPRGFWRAPGHNATVWVDQSFIDDVAKVAGKDPVTFRLDLLGSEDKKMPYRDHGGPTYSTQRLANVINLLADKTNWHTPLPNGMFRGFACHFMFGAYVAMVATISNQKQGVIIIEEITVMADCGIVINPSSARNQLEGGIIDGLSVALGQAIHIEDGAVKEKNFDSYKLMRMKDAPRINVHFVTSKESPEGLGEMSLPLVAPALCNAIYAATKIRITKLPIEGFKIEVRV